MPQPRRRPKNRKAQIANVAAEAFSEQGYHAVSMDDIANRVGVSAAALYRHSPSKYDLFRTAVLALSEQLLEATAFADELPVAEHNAPQVYDRLVSALIDVALANRSRGGVYRWGSRYLVDDDPAALTAQMKMVNLRLQKPIRVLRPELGSQQRWTLSVSVLGVIGSLVDHRAALSSGRVHGLFGEMARALLWARLPASPADAPVPPAPERAVAAGRFEAILREAMRLFLQNGYRHTTVDEIARAVGMPTSGIYRYFPGKADILTALFRRAADRLSADTAVILAAHADPATALNMLVHSYVGRSLDHPGIDSLYFTERPNLSPADGVLLRNMQRATVDSWVEVLTAVYPDLSHRDARFVVQAAFALVVDVAALTLAGHRDLGAVGATMGTLMTAVLSVPAGPDAADRRAVTNSSKSASPIR